MAPDRPRPSKAVNRLAGYLIALLTGGSVGWGSGYTGGYAKALAVDDERIKTNTRDIENVARAAEKFQEQSEIRFAVQERRVGALEEKTSEKLTKIMESLARLEERSARDGGR